MLVNTYFLERYITKLVYTDILDLLVASHYKLCPEACYTYTKWYAYGLF